LADVVVAAVALMVVTAAASAVVAVDVVASTEDAVEDAADLAAGDGAATEDAVATEAVVASAEALATELSQLQRARGRRSTNFDAPHSCLYIYSEYFLTCPEDVVTCFSTPAQCSCYATDRCSECIPQECISQAAFVYAMEWHTTSTGIDIRR